MLDRLAVRIFSDRLWHPGCVVIELWKLARLDLSVEMGSAGGNWGCKAQSTTGRLHEVNRSFEVYFVWRMGLS